MSLEKYAAGSDRNVARIVELEQWRPGRGRLLEVGVTSTHWYLARKKGWEVTGEWWSWICPPTHLWFFSSKTLPRLLRDCGFEVLEVRTLRGYGNNFYQYALIWAGRQLNKLRQLFRTGAQPTQTHQGEQPTTSTVSRPEPPGSETPSPSGLLDRWMHLLRRAQPVTNALARGTRPLLEPLERRGGVTSCLYTRGESLVTNKQGWLLFYQGFFQSLAFLRSLKRQTQV